MRRGFTLVEVMVALAIGALVVLLAHRTFAVASELRGRVTERREAHDRAMNARRLLAQAFGSLEVSTVRNTGFRGMEDEVAFTTWLRDEIGAPVRKQVTLRMDAAADRETDRRLIAVVAPGPGAASSAPDTLVLVPSASALALDYLLDFGADAAWVREWHSPASAPLAVRLRIAREGEAVDTLLLVIGPRG